MLWVRRLLLLAGLVLGGWLLGSATANADVKIEIDLPIAQVTVELGTTPDAPPAPPAESPPTQPRTETPPSPPPPAVAVPSAPRAQQVVVEAPLLQPQAAEQPASPTTEAPQAPSEPQRLDLPMSSSPPQSGAGQSANTPPVGTLTFAVSRPHATSSVVPTGDQDVPLSTHADDPSFSPD